MSKNTVEPAGPQMTLQYGVYALHAGQARLYARTRMYTPTHPSTRTHALSHTQTSMQYLLLFHGHNCHANAPWCYIIRTLPVFSSLTLLRTTMYSCCIMTTFCCFSTHFTANTLSLSISAVTMTTG